MPPADKGDELKEVTIAHRSFPYKKEVDHEWDPDRRVLKDVTAARGEKVKLRPQDHARGERLGSFLKPGQTLEDFVSGTPTGNEVFSAVDATDTELIEWIKDKSPTVQQVVDASEGDAETAERLLSAETAASGGDPRKGVIVGLEAVINRSRE